MISRNGTSNQFRFVIKHPVTGALTALDFSFKHNALREYVQEEWVTVRLIDGSVRKRFLYLHWIFQIDWSQCIEGEDADKLAQVKNNEYAGGEIFLYPHLDLLTRNFEVVSMNEGQTEFSQIVNRDNSPGNKGHIVTYQTKWPDYSFKLWDPDSVQGVSALSFEEFI